ncbi:MAG: T9SS type A sorting domain-containing protein [Candidatus Eisenbacteria sp.]|nr:T9SS type A sorting domain-containing protein [Candidatus Eisenbacteria bacterium]
MKLPSHARILMGYTLPVLLAAIIAPAAGAMDRACGDFIWDECEWCGQDAYFVTGRTEMNHDCWVDLIDFSLFALEWTATGPGLSADYNRDESVDLWDFVTFANSWDLPVPGCEPCDLLPDGCQGTIRLSFDFDDPAHDLDTIVLPPDSEYVAMVVLEGCDSLTSYCWDCKLSSNLDLISWSHVGDLEIAGVGAFRVPLDDSAHFIGELWFAPLDDAPAWIRLQSGNSPAYELSWAKTPPGRRMYFPVIGHAGINGPPPPDSTGCPPSGVGDILPGRANGTGLRCSPNPALRSVAVLFDTASPVMGTVAIHDPAGRIVRLLHRGHLRAGSAAWMWDGLTDQGEPARTGVYFIRLQTDQRRITSRFVWLR